jgi:hypothetical protein
MLAVLVGVGLAAVATLARRRLVAFTFGGLAAIFLFFVRNAVRSNNVRAFGRDALGRVSEPEARSAVGVGYYVAIGAVAIILGGALLGARSRSQGSRH